MDKISTQPNFRFFFFFNKITYYPTILENAKGNMNFIVIFLHVIDFVPFWLEHLVPVCKPVHSRIPHVPPQVRF